jgi:hypothetical protein
MKSNAIAHNLWETIIHSVDYCNGTISEENEAIIHLNFHFVNYLRFSFWPIIIYILFSM